MDLVTGYELGGGFGGGGGEGEFGCVGGFVGLLELLLLRVMGGRVGSVGEGDFGGGELFHVGVVARSGYLLLVGLGLGGRFEKSGTSGVMRSRGRSWTVTVDEGGWFRAVLSDS